MDQASFDGTLYFPSLNLQLAIRRSHYRWSQLLDHRGRPKSKVRLGSFQVEVLATQSQLAELTQLATDPHAIIDGHATYHRADGQGTFVTVWFRQATLHHFTEHFDATGMRGSEPSWVVFFARSPQEMGREKGQAGMFVLPAPREHDKSIIIAVLRTVYTYEHCRAGFSPSQLGRNRPNKGGLQPALFGWGVH